MRGIESARGMRRVALPRLLFSVLFSQLCMFTLDEKHAIAADPWADRVISYVSGTGVDPFYKEPLTALGSPERFTGEGIFPGCVTPFNPAWGSNEIVSIGPGGSLVLAFDEPVMNDPLNPFGVDLLVFGNSGLIDFDFPNGSAGAYFGSNPLGIIEVSPDGLDWRQISGARPEGRYPTLGYADLTDPYALTPGSIFTDFTRPVNPAYNPIGQNFSQIVAAYGGSGGGEPIDIGSVGFSHIFFVRFSLPAGASGTVEIDAVSTVSPIPAPASLVILASAGVAASRRRRSV